MTNVAPVVQAAIVLRDVEGVEHVVAFGAGNKCLPDKHKGDGDVVRDCHAEILARRAFLR